MEKLDAKRASKVNNIPVKNIKKMLDHFSILYQIFFSPQVKRSVIISNKHVINKLPHELLKDLRLRILGN